MGEALVVSTTLQINPDEFRRWIIDCLERGENEVELEGFTFTLKIVYSNPATVVGISKNGSITIEVVGHTVVATETKSEYPLD